MYTVVEMYQGVLQELRRQETTSMNPVEFNYYCKKAVYQYITNRYADFEKHQKITDDLQKLILTFDGIAGNPQPLSSVTPSQQIPIPGQEVFNIPPIAKINTGKEKVFLLDVQFGFQCGPSDGTATSIVYHDARIKHHDEKRTKNVYSMPDEKRGQFYYTQTGNQIRRFGGTTPAYRAKITIIKNPTIPELNPDGTMLVETEFDARVNQEIVRYIVRDYLEVIESMRQNSYDANTSANFNQPTLNRK